MNEDYIIRRAESENDAKKLHDLFSQVFYPEDVGVFAETIFHHFPGIKKKYWFIAEEKRTGHIVSAFALIPWTWKFAGIKVNVAEMGIVGTQEKHRNRGLIRTLNIEFDKTIKEEGFDCAVIQGIAGFYHQFGYYYAVPLENHINLPPHLIPDQKNSDTYSFRLAGEKDIPFLMEQDTIYRSCYGISCLRGEAHWKYLLTNSRNTIYGSEFWIMEPGDGGDTYYFRVPGYGFGKGLIVSECSESITPRAMESLLSFCKKKAIERKKPYIRVNLHNESTLGKMAISMGTEEGTPYAWQIKIQDIPRFLIKIATLFEKRLKDSCFRNFTGKLRLDFFKTKIDCLWEKGKLKAVTEAEGESEWIFHINTDLFPPLCLGHRTQKELRTNRPDIFPNSGKCGLLIDTIFPRMKSWIYEEY
jgi:predicted N-acetyltransferase YhbS